MDSIITPGTKVNGNDDTALESELSGYLDRIITKNGTSKDIEGYVKNAQAIINTLSDKGSGGARARVTNSIASAMNRHQIALKSASGDEQARLASTFGSLGSRTLEKYGKDYKKDNPGTNAMLGDIAKGDFSKADTFTPVNELDLDGNPTGTIHLRSTAYSRSGLDGMSTEDYSKLKANGLSNILGGLQAGDISGAEAREVARMSDEVLNSDIYKQDADARAYTERIRSAALANTGVESDGRTSGSKAMAQSSTAALGSIVSNLQAAPNWSALNPAQQANYRNLLSNVTETLNNDYHSPENSD